MIASRLGVPVVPVRLDGLDEVLHHTLADGAPRPRPRRVRRADARWSATTTRRWRSRSRRRSGRCDSGLGELDDSVNSA